MRSDSPRLTWACLVALSIAACSSGGTVDARVGPVDGGEPIADATTRDADEPTADAMTRDATPAPDGGVSPDAEAPRDAEARPDAEPAPDARAALHVYVGSARGSIAHFVLDEATGALDAREVTAAGQNPSFLARSPDARHMYAVDEVGAGRVRAFAIDGASGALTARGDVATGGNGPTHLVVEPGGRAVLVAHYNDGQLAVVPIRGDGTLEAPSQRVFAGRNAHQAVVDPAGRSVFVPCLGEHYVAQYALAADARSVSPRTPATTALASGSGPRHLAFTADGRFAFVLGELDSTLTPLTLDVAAGTFAVGAPVSTLPLGFPGANSTAEVVVHPTLAVVYASNRGHDSIARFTFDRGDGALTAIDQTITGGSTPRSFAIDDVGRWLVVANQNSDDVTTMHIDAADGALTPTGARVQLARPSFVGAWRGP